MKKNIILILSVILVGIMNINSYASSSNKRDTRAVWVSSVWNLDWPKNVGNAQVQKEEFINLLDDIQRLKFNTIIVQVSPKADALYRSSINPWSDVLTGTQGKDPGYDPLQFMIDEAHKRNIEIHAWFNPYRITATEKENNKLALNHFARKRPDLVVNHGGKLYYNPGMPEVREHLVSNISEVVSNYDIDGIHFDDYFYPGTNFDDKKAYDKYGTGMALGDFRRDSVNKLVKEVNSKIKQIKSHVKFGISPRGIWKNKSSDQTGSNTNGGQSYFDIFADTRTWIKNEWVDYVTPQIYWNIAHKLADYSKLVPWWSNEVANKNVSLYIGHDVSKSNIVSEIDKQVNLSDKYLKVKGNTHFRYESLKNDNVLRDKINSLYKYESLPNTMPWIDSTPPQQPVIDHEVRGNKIDIKIKNNSDASYYLVYRFSSHEDINIEDSRKIVAKIRRNSQDQSIFTDYYNSGNKYVVTSVDRLHNESNPKEVMNSGINYQSHIQDHGWQGWVGDSEASGLPHDNKRIEAIKIDTKDLNYINELKYEVYIQNLGWQGYKHRGEVAGTQGEAKGIEAFRIHLDANIGYQLEYRVYINGQGWQDWKRDGDIAGIVGQSMYITSLEIRVANKPQGDINYKSHVSELGWQSWRTDSEISGTVGQSKSLESIEISLGNELPKGASIEYRTHVSKLGWQDWKSNGQLAGTVGQSKSLEAVEIKLKNAPGYKLQYRTHVSKLGWQDWKQDGEQSGTTGQSKSLEALQIRVFKENIIPEDEAPKDSQVSYKSHISDIGWQNWKKDGEQSGTVGMSKSLESIIISTGSQLPEGSSIEYRTHISDIGWDNWKKDGDLSGTVGRSKSLEAIEIKLKNAPGYKLEYRTHVSELGWQGWRLDGEISGTTGQSKSLEAIQIMIVKDDEAPKDSQVSYKSHIIDMGWQEWKKDEETSGSVGKSKALESIMINVGNKLPEGSSIEYRTHIKYLGWQEWKKDGKLSGTVGKSKKLEAIEIRLKNAPEHSVEYRTHVSEVGWQDWKKDGELSGLIEETKSIEAIEVKVVNNTKI